MNKLIEKLVEYASVHLSLGELDKIYVRNLLLNRFKEDKPYEGEIDKEEIKSMNTPDVLIEEIKEKAINRGIVDEAHADLFACEIMGIISLRPNEFLNEFNKRRKEQGVDSALNFFYDYEIKNNYIQKTSIDKNILWTYDRLERIEISINLSKPEKKNSDIAKMLNVSSTSYPKCLLCKDNLGFSGNLSKAPRQNIRIIPLTMGGEKWFLQYSPYGYYREHCIVINDTHKPMTIGRQTFVNLFDFIDEFPTYFIGSNADLPIVGGSILSHEHYQGGRHRFPLFDSKVRYVIEKHMFPSVKMEYLNWYNSVIKLSGTNRDEITNLASHILNKWKQFDCEEVDIISHDSNGPHSTITPIANMENGRYQLFLILRNNRCNEKYPEGIFHAHKEHHNIKSEGIGLIEAMGLFILPGRLERQIREIEYILSNKVEVNDEYLEKRDISIHREMINRMINDFGQDNSEKKAHEIIINHINDTCLDILSNTAVFKKDENGEKAFRKFIEFLGV